MKRILVTTALVAAAGVANAGGIDRSGQFLGPIFETTGENGYYVQLSFGSVEPSTTTNIMGVASGQPLDTYTSGGFALKYQVNDAVSMTLIYDQPFGAAVSYPAGAPFFGGFADIRSEALTLVGRYEMDGGFSVHGGLRASKLFGKVQTSRRIEAGSDFEAGYVLGVAYEKPEIALRVALTYNSAIDHTIEGLEYIPFFNPVGAAVSTTVTTPESWNLEFQSGVAKDTLVFGSIRRAMWDGFNLTSPSGTYAAFVGDTTAYTLGVGRRFNENWSGAITLGYEAAGTKPTTTALAPYTGSTSIGVGATYTKDNMKVSFGVTYAELGDQDLNPAINWTGGKAVGAGIRLGFSF